MNDKRPSSRIPDDWHADDRVRPWQVIAVIVAVAIIAVPWVRGVLAFFGG